MVVDADAAVKEVDVTKAVDVEKAVATEEVVQTTKLHPVPELSVQTRMEQ